MGAAGVNAEQVQHYGPEEKNEYLIQTTKVSVVGPKLKEDAEGNDISAEEVANSIKAATPLKSWEWAKENPNRLELTFQKDADVDEQAVLSAVESVGLKAPELNDAPSTEFPKFVVRFQGLQESIEQGLAAAVPDAYNTEKEGSVAGIKRMETVGPRAGEQLRNRGILSLVIALFFILVYVAFRFDLRYAPGAVAALTHDIIIAVGFFTFTGLEITLPIIAALLTIVGYSLNDTIVVFDRIRENLEGAGGKAMKEISNRSLNETLSRTLITSLTTLLAVVAIAVLATGLIQNFAIALIVGVIVGTYSSVYIATPVMLRMDEVLEEWRDSREKQAEQAEHGQV
jgi:preprotein translocase subunit SecF